MIDSKRDENNEIKLQYTLSQGETPISQMLLKKNEPREHVEVCPGSGVIVKHIADRLEKDGGFALIVDYGHDGEKTDTFRVKRSCLLTRLRNDCAVMSNLYFSLTHRNYLAICVIGS